MIIKSNEFWGKRAGSTYKDGSRAFLQQQWGCGASSSGNRSPRFHWPMKRKDMGSGNLKGQRVHA